jgi:hypothetical protein
VPVSFPPLGNVYGPSSRHPAYFRPAVGSHIGISSVLFAGFEATQVEKLEYSADDLVAPERRIELALLSPSFGVLERILAGGILLEGLHWREFEELIADLLSKDGWAVELGPGRSDSGVDIFAKRDLGASGPVAAVW